MDKYKLVFNKIIGKKINYILKATDMLDIGIGDTIPWENYSGEVKSKPEFAIHITSPWRIIKNNILLLGKFDLFIDKDGEFLQDVADISKFDELSKKEFLGLKENSQIKSIEISQLGDLQITIVAKKNNLQIETFKYTNYSENWRIIDFYTQKHYVENEQN